jgi:wyosine [tRNA(Phe)-imidazoG37] synthetase (radical SAM superfamily)
MSDANSLRSAGSLFEAHPRTFQANHYVYPVLSRRSGGISIGVNLNLDKVCNFHCIYCQVDRAEPAEKEFVAVDRLAAELDATIELVTSGRIYEDLAFARTPAAMRRLCDVAFSGDAEPTTYTNFDEVVAATAEVHRRHRLDEVKLVLITNASMLHRERVRQALEILDRNNGEIWAKLDAGSEEHYRRVNRSAVSFRQILDNLLATARVRPIAIQSLWMRIEGEPPPEREQDAYCDRLSELVAGGGQIKLVQLYTVARPPAESYVSALADAELDALADRVGRRTGLPVATFYGKQPA